MGILSVLGILLGLILVIHPLIGVAALPFILGIFMLIGGVGAVVQAFRIHREEPRAQLAPAGALGQATSEKLAFRDCPKRVCRIVCCSSDRVKETSCEGNHIMAIHGNWHRRRLSRRDFLSLGGMSAVALALGSCGARPSGGAVGYGPLVQDPAGILDLPSGFQYRMISEEGSTLSNGAPVPGAHDGMAAFPGAGRHHHPGAQPRTTTKRRVRRSVGKNPYRSSQRGGTTGIVVGPEPQGDKGLRHLVGHPQQLRGRGDAVGYLAHLRGGPRNTNHGYVFEVDPKNPENKLSKTPIRAMGYFSHEAADIDPATGIVYLTEDDFRGTAPPDPNDELLAPPASASSTATSPTIRALHPGLCKRAAFCKS